MGAVHDAGDDAARVDDRGQTVRLTGEDQERTRTLSYDKDGHVTSERGFTYSYNADGDITWRKYPDAER